MFNPISYTYLYIKKNFNRKFLQIIGYLLVFLCCLFTLIKWNTIPHFEDKIDFYGPTPFCNNVQKKGVIEITIKSPYLSYAFKDSTGGNVNLHCILSHEYETPIKSIYGEKKVLQDEIIDLGDLEKIQTIIDSMPTFGLYILRYRKSHHSYEKFFNIVDKRKTKKDFFHENNVFCLVKDHFHSFPSHSEGYIITGSNGRGFYDCESRVTPSNKQAFMLNRIIALNDISQANYSLTIGDLPITSDSIILNIDFGGATRFAGISPTPDEYTYSGIMYSDQEKIKKIRHSKIKLHCQFLETTNIQSTRVYVLSTIATFFFGLFAKLLIENTPSLLRYIYRKISKVHQLRADMLKKNFKTMPKLLRWYSYSWNLSLWTSIVYLYASIKHSIECGFMGCTPGMMATEMFLFFLPLSLNSIFALRIKAMWKKGEKEKAISVFRKCKSFHKLSVLIKHCIVITIIMVAIAIFKEYFHLQ